MKTYLVTGAAGFIGARFVESCNARGISLISVDHLAFFEQREEHQGLKFGQVVDRDILLRWLGEQDNTLHLDGIIHLGAITDTRETSEDLLNRWNLDYSRTLWSYATRNKIPFVYASSAATYGDGALGFEDDESKIQDLKPLNLYGESKLRFDQWALSEERMNHCPPAWSGYKFFNVYGFGESHKRFMSSVVLHAYEEIKKTGQVTLFKSHKDGIADGEQKRDFIFVDDLVEVLHFALEKPIRRGIYNLGTGRAQSFLELARAVFSALGKKEQIKFVDTPVSIRDKYQYFTEATMDRLRAQGYGLPFHSLSEGAHRYVKRLQSKN